ncbi:MAG: tRNA pseudouridine(55) synthase TruB [Hespellia sp.]|nr:tRNA pseudouridine(55) synthase TruB [Hespellia sp.]
MIHGVLNVYKEKGFTSHDVVAKLRGIVGQKKIGHTGTLDPDATGVLPVCLGKATKLCDMLTDKNKTYEAVLLLGITTDTQDTTGEILCEKDTNHLSEQKVIDCIRGYIGEYDQLPPMYSALKVNGRKLYELAREGKVVERKTRRVQIFDIDILEMNLPEVRMRVSCSKGTYIRTLCHDIGESLGVGGCMKSLVRTKVSRFCIEDAKTLDEIAVLKSEGRLSEYMIPVDEMFPTYQKVVMKEEYVSLAYNGNQFAGSCVDVIPSGQKVRVYDKENRFIGIYDYNEKENMFKIQKMFLDQKEIRG